MCCFVGRTGPTILVFVPSVCFQFLDRLVVVWTGAVGFHSTGPKVEPVVCGRPDFTPLVHLLASRNQPNLMVNRTCTRAGSVRST